MESQAAEKRALRHERAFKLYKAQAASSQQACLASESRVRALETENMQLKGEVATSAVTHARQQAQFTVLQLQMDAPYLVTAVRAVWRFNYDHVLCGLPPTMAL